MRNRTSKILALQPLTTASATTKPAAHKSTAPTKSTNIMGTFSCSVKDHCFWLGNERSSESTCCVGHDHKFWPLRTINGTLYLLDGLAAIHACPRVRPVSGGHELHHPVPLRQRQRQAWRGSPVSQHVSIVRNKGASVVVAVLCCRVDRWSSTSTPLRVEPTDTFTPLAFPI
jgi:hypothetical protein